MLSTLSLFSYLSVALAVVAPVLGASPTIKARDNLPLNPQGIQPKPLTSLVARAPLPVPQTNAERMKRGLNPMMPKRFVHAGRSLYARQSPTPCTPYDGFIKASYVGTNGAAVENYVAATPNSFAEYTEVEDIGHALHVTFCASPDSPFEVHTINGIASYPLLGLFTGYASSSPSLSAGSSNYALFAGVAHSDAYAEPSTNGGNSFTFVTDIQESSESTIWYLDQGSLELTVQWINTDGNSPDVYVGFSSSGPAFFATGDFNAFEGSYGASSPVTFTFVPSGP